MTSDLVASSPITHQPKNLRYDVFLSFRGDDTRDNFVSHLHKALSNHQIKTFIDYNLTTGADFPPALLSAIEESLISIIIFSENYADSTWCLKELAKIMECKNSNEQIVLPVFYGVDPSHVRNQTGNFGAAFDKLQECSKGKTNFYKARSHLMEVANISGWDSHVTRPESQLILGIVGDVLHKLNLFSFSYSTNLVGVFPHIEKVEFLLCLDASDVSVVGICGMGGIGKSTIARAVFNHIYQKFDASHFVSNIQGELKGQLDMLLLKVFEKECQTMGTHSLGPDFIRRQLPQKKVFIVLDDVNDPIQLKELLGGQNYSFGSGSKILITSRDRQVLKNVTDKIHTMETMNEKDAMTLFSLNAFKQKYPRNSYKELSERAIYYADGNPLALAVLGSALFDRSKELWVSALEGLEKELNCDIKKVLRTSYDTLSFGEKKIFLDIACYLFGCHQDFINHYYDNSEIFTIKTLEDKCLVTISSCNTIEMHDLLKEIGRSIDRENYLDKPEKHERLWNPKDVCSFLTKKTGPAKIEALSMDMCKIEELHLDCDVFVGMDSLQFLKFFNSKKVRKNKVYFNGGRVEYLPPELRYFQWDGFPANHLPSKFMAENLIELQIHGSNIEELWRGDKSQGIFSNLQVLSLQDCSNLIKIPDISNAMKLRRIDLRGCFNCENVPSVFVSEVLEYLNLAGCLNVTRFPDISSKSLKILDLSGTNIEEVPSSIEYFSRLEGLRMNNCQKLSTISTKICKLKSLTYFEFTFCLKLESFPEISEPMENLKEIQLDSCLNLKSLPRIWYNMESLEVLDLSYCENLNISSVANAIPSFSFLKELYLVANNWEMLPENMDQLANLEHLDVWASRRLRFVPKLPSSLQTLEAQYCGSLESIKIGVRGNKLRCLSFINCIRLQEVTRTQILAHSHFMMTQLAGDYDFCVLPGTEIPEWMGMGVGSCVTIKFPSSHDIKYWSQFRGFGFCVVFSPITDSRTECAFIVSALCLRCISFKFQCILKQNDHVICRLGIESLLLMPRTEHLFMWRCIDDLSELDLDELMGKEVFFEFSVVTNEGWDRLVFSIDVRNCGVQVLFENTAPLPTSLISSATNTEDDQLLISASSSIPPSLQKPSKLTRLKCLPFLPFSN